MDTDQQQRPGRWLAGWYTTGWYTDPDSDAPFHIGTHPEAPWHEAAAWLRGELHRLAQEGPSGEVHTVHIEPVGTIRELTFETCWTFIEWACQHRQHRGLYGRDKERCYYIIAADDGDGTLDQARPPVDATAPLPQSASGAHPVLTQ